MKNWLKGFCLIAALLTPSCGTLTDPQSEVVGKYVLLAVGSQPLPVALPLDGPPRLLLTADTLWLRSDGSYEEHMTREVIGPAPLTLTGRFSVAGSFITLTETGAAPVSGRLRDSTLTLGDASSSAFHYVRRCTGASC